ncbi:MAG TPA: radical SAM family heme chaperone HemW, partial [Rhabdochlamydiaceae bacterium]|nr:radical SAM family heme chaperone HemW [Rhabdochlamydiaceae bacterium]
SKEPKNRQKLKLQTHSEISLYFHIPFCRRKCPYCHFFVIPHETESAQTLLDSLRLEWDQNKHLVSGKQIVSVYFGGGTPFLIGPKAISEILSWIQPPLSAEITLEANPEDITLPDMQAFAQAGINRVSLGIQSLDNHLLKLLGRHHTAQQGISAIHAVKEAGISNITVDLMYEIPKQTLSSWKNTLSQLETLPITHLSLYNLTFEPQTLFYKKRSELTPELPSSEESLQMLKLATQVLEKMSLKRYEISAFAKDGFTSRHNTGYWAGRPFLGFGPSAFSFWEGKRYRNVCNLKKYSSLLQSGSSPVDFTEQLSPLASLHERLAVNLRILEGVDIQEFPVGNPLYLKLQEKGWLHLNEQRARLTDQGLLFYDSVAEEIIL